ncbi:MAG TPA: helix-turn-helix domain-containing protein [Solirubrobacteraceae bacterium]|nr:helix-turn-helix domain-containing protein [Solirubrobacteraceae bacterium]
MRPPSDKRAARGEATRAKLIATARELFAERGYAAVGTNEVVQRAGVTRGAMYHHFRDKKDLFRAVHEQAERELVAASAAPMQHVEDPWERLMAGMHGFFDACEDPRLRRIALVDAPAVLGWQEWRAVGREYGLAAMTLVLQAAMDAGALRRVDVTNLAHLLIAALSEAAMMLANADDPVAARREVEATLLVLLEGLRPVESG